MIKVSSRNYVLKFRLPAKISLTSSFHCSPVRSSFEDLRTLGLAENATKDEIKAAYFTKAKQFHPDSSTSGSQGSAEFQKLNEAYKRLMYESKFTDKNSQHYQDAQRYQGYNNRNYRSPDPRNYSHGPQNPFDGFENFKNRDPRSNRSRQENPFNDGSNDHKDPRSYRYRRENPWADPWERMYRSNQTEKPKLSQQQQDILRRTTLQIFFGFILAQMLIFHIFNGRNNPKHPGYYDGGTAGGCKCAMCLERRQQMAQQNVQNNEI